MTHTIYFYKDHDRYIGISDNGNNNDLFEQLPKKMDCDRVTCKISLNTPTNTYGSNDCEYILTSVENNYILYEFSSEFNIGEPRVSCNKYVLPKEKMTRVEFESECIENTIHVEHPIYANKEVTEWCESMYNKKWDDLRLIDQRQLRDIYEDRCKLVSEVPGYIPSNIDIWMYGRCIFYKQENGTKQKTSVEEIIKTYGSLNFMYEIYNSMHKYILSKWWKKSPNISKRKMCKIHIFHSPSFREYYGKKDCIACGNPIHVLYENEQPDSCGFIKYNKDPFFIFHYNTSRIQIYNDQDD